MANKISARAAIEREAEKLTEPIAAGHGVRIYDVEYVKEGPEYYLNIYIDKDGGVGILDCEAERRWRANCSNRTPRSAGRNLKEF